ncbi:MAG: SGNH/GDSL hydrolase family protein, partial [Planktothrix sp.]
MMKKSLSKILLLLFCWTIVPLFLVEILMIVLEPQLSQGLYQYDPDLGFKIRPYANGNNQFGFNDRDYPLQKEPGKYRILILSDSFNWAGGKEGNYTTLLEQKFAQYYQNSQVEVINAGYPGTHTGEQLALLKKYALEYRPDLVILGFFVGNDFIDAKPNRKRIIVNDIYIDIDKRQELKLFGYPIINQSRLLLFIQQKYKVFQEAQKAQKQSISPYQVQFVINQAEPEKSPGILSLETFLATEKTRLDFCKRQDLQKGVWNGN